jgi:hypothetical protein
MCNASGYITISDCIQPRFLILDALVRHVYAPFRYGDLVWQRNYAITSSRSSRSSSKSAAGDTQARESSTTTDASPGRSMRVAVVTTATLARRVHTHTHTERERETRSRRFRLPFQICTNLSYCRTTAEAFSVRYDSISCQPKA